MCTHLPIRQQLLVLFLVVATLITTLGANNLGNLTAVSQSTVLLYEHPFMVLSRLAEFRAGTFRIELLVRDMLSGAQKPDATIVAQKCDVAAEALRSAASHYLGPTEDFQAVSEAYAAWTDFAIKVVEQAAKGNIAESQALYARDGRRLFDIISARRDNILASSRGQAAEFVAKSSAAASRARNTSVLLIGLSLLFGAGVALIIGRNITRPLFSLRDTMMRLARDEVTDEVPHFQRRGEVGDMARTLEIFKNNIIERRSLADKLSISESSASSLRAVMDAAPDPIFFVDDKSGLILEVSSGARRLFGHAPEDMAGKSIEAFVPDVLRHSQKTPEQQNDSDSVRSDIEFVAIRRDGADVPVDVTIVPVLTDGVSINAIIVRDISARRSAEHQLRRSEKLLAAAERIAGVGSWEVDIKSNTVYRSQEFLRIMELEDEPAQLERGVPELTIDRKIHPADRSQFDRMLEIIRMDEPSRSFEHRVVLNNGHIRHIRTHFETTFDEHGNRLKVTGTTQDVTTEKLMEETLRQNEQRLSDAQRVSLVGSWEAFPETGYVYCSDGLYNLYELNRESLGVSPKDAAWKMVELTHPDDRWRLNLFRAGHVEAPQEGETEYRVIMPDGRTKYMAARVSHQYGETGRIVRMLGVVQDVSAQRLAEQKIQERESLLRLVINSVPVSIAYLDVNGSVMFVNEAASKWLGASPSDLAGRCIWNLIGKEEYEIFHPLSVRALAGETVYEEVETQSINGALRWLAVQVVPHLALDNRVDGLYILIWDMDDRKRMERQLIQVQKMEAIGQLTGGIAHDFNNILTVIRGNLQLVSLSPDGAEVERHISRAVEACAQASDLVSRLLTFSRKQELHPRKIAVCDLVRNLTKLLRGTLFENIELVTIFPDKPVWVHTDPAQLDGALVNLCLNARDAMPKGGRVTIKVSVLGKNHGAWPIGVLGTHVCVSVSDTGCGMTEEIRQRALEPFFTTKDFGKGSGLGLSMVHGFVEQSGGELVIESEVGKGTTVSLYFPESPAANDQAVSEPSEVIVNTGVHTILVVEDRLELREMVCTFLASQGYRIVQAANGAEALDFVQKGGKLDLLFTDIIMPGGMNGMELAVRAKAIAPELQVLYTTGFVHEREAAVLDESAVVIRKPYSLSELAAAVDNALKPGAA